MKRQHTYVAAVLAALLALAGVTAAIAADAAGDPPPRIAFLANGIVPADALAAGPIAGQLGAPVFTTQPDALSAPAAEGLESHAPELVIVLGGPVAVSDAVVAQAAAVTGLDVVDPASRPESGVVRAAGGDRFETAKVVAELLGDYDPAWLGVGLLGDYALADQACTAGKVVTGIAADGTPICATDQVGSFDGDADTLDGMDSSDFQPAGDYALADQKCSLGSLVSGITAVGDISCSSDQVDGGDAETLDGLDSTDFAAADLAAFVPIATFIVDDSGSVQGSQWRAPLTGPPTVDATGAASGNYLVDLPGHSVTFYDDTVVCSRAETGPGTIHHETYSGDLRVLTTDTDGNGAASWFHCAVYDG